MKKYQPVIIMTSIVVIIFTLFTLFCLIWLSFFTNYPTSNELTYQEYTFIDYQFIEHIRRPTSTRYYEIYVKELEKPIRIDNIVYSKTNQELLDFIKPNEVILVSIKQTKKRPIAYAIKYQDDYILTYEDYLYKHQKNDTTGIVVSSIMTCVAISLFIYFIYALKKDKFK